MSEKTAVTEAEIAALITSCNEADGTSYGTDADADSIRVRRDEKGLSAALLSWRLGERFCGKEMEELLAFVRPDLRRQGLFTGLFREAGPSLSSYLRASVCENEGALRALSALGAEHLYDEFLMERPLPFQSEDPGKEHTELSRRGSASLLRREEEEDAVRFSTPQSELYVRPLGESAFLFGVFTSSRSRGRVLACKRNKIIQGPCRLLRDSFCGKRFRVSNSCYDSGTSNCGSESECDG